MYSAGTDEFFNGIFTEIFEKKLQFVQKIHENFCCMPVNIHVKVREKLVRSTAVSFLV
jgi:hypothetical protein